MIDVSYVVLHYQALDETIECVESIKKYHGQGETVVVVVDNASPNGTGESLIDKYRNDSQVVVIKNKDNLGFANGLNTGIEYLRNNLSCKFICLLNNDTELLSENWDGIVISKYEQYHFAALGPDIVSADGKIHSNPSRKQDITENGVRKLIRQKQIDYLKDLIYLRPISIYLRTIVKKIIKYKPKSKYVNQDTTDVQLQGSCIILSPKYFEHYDALYRRTFLYFEEAILRYRCEKHNLVSLYCPDLKLLHKGSVSIDGNFNNKRKKEMFYYKESMNSCKRFLSDRTSGLE